jgi:Phage integrase, N-terminal SAM-like domain
MEPFMSAQTAARKPELLEQFRDFLRLKHYAYRTEEAYLDWVRRYILFHQKQHPRELGAEAVRDFDSLASARSPFGLVRFAY